MTIRKFPGGTKMKNMKLGAKIALGFGVLIIIAAILGVVGVWEMGTVKTETTKLPKNMFPKWTWPPIWRNPPTV